MKEFKQEQEDTQDLLHYLLDLAHQVRYILVQYFTLSIFLSKRLGTTKGTIRLERPEREN